MTKINSLFLLLFFSHSHSQRCLDFKIAVVKKKKKNRKCHLMRMKNWTACVGKGIRVQFKGFGFFFRTKESDKMAKRAEEERTEDLGGDEEKKARKRKRRKGEKSEGIHTHTST